MFHRKPGTAWAAALVPGLVSVSHAVEPATALVAPKVIISASRFEERFDDRPLNATVISREQIDHSTAASLPDLLSQQAGIASRDLYGNSVSGSTVDMRGFGSNATQNTLILLDGRPLNDIDISGVQWPAIPLAEIDRVEILRGTGAVQYGAGASAGVINIITRRPDGRASDITVGASAGSFDSREFRLSAAKGFGDLGIRVFGSDYRSGGYRDNNQNRQRNANADLRWAREGDEIRLTASTDRQDIRLPGARLVDFGTGVDELRTQRRGTSTPLDYATRNGTRVALEGARRLADLEFAAGVSYRNKDQLSYYDFAGFPDYRDIHLDVLGVTPRVKWSRPLAGFDNTLVTGVDWYRWDYDLILSNGPQNIGRPTHVVDGVQHNRAYYMQDYLTLREGTTLSAGLRREQFRIETTDGFDPFAPGAFGPGSDQSSRGAQRNDQTAWDVGIRQSLARGWSAGARAGRSFRFATIDEIYEFSPVGLHEFQFLRPQRATTYEVSAEHGGPALHARAALFRIDVDDEIRLDPYTTGRGNTNLPPLRRQGLELSGAWQALDPLRLTLAYTYTRARFREGVLPGGGPSFVIDADVAGRTVPLVPTHRIALGAAWSFSEATRLTLNQTVVSRMVMDNDEVNTFVRIPGYGVTDLKLVHERGSWRLSLSVNNLFGHDYYEYAVRSQYTAQRFNAYPLPGRNAMASANYTFR